MKLRRFTTLNFCQHRGEHTWELTGPIVGILGENGSGKSNLTKGIYAALSGEWERERRRMITFGETRASIELEFEVRPGLVATVTRELHRDKVSLVFAGDAEPKVTGSKAVNARILELLETDRTILSSIVFIPQDELASLLFSDATANARLANRFFGLERCVQVEKGLSEKIAEVQLTSLPADPVLLQNEIDALQAKLDTLAALPALPVVDPAEAPAIRQGIAGAQAAAEKWLEADRRHRRRIDLETQLALQVTERDRLQELVDKVPIGELRDTYVLESEKRRVHEGRRAVWSRRETLLDERLRLDSEFLHFRPNEESLAADRQHLAELEALEGEDGFVRREQNALLARVEHEGDGQPCRVCLKPAHWTETEIQPILDDQARPRQNAQTLRDIAALRRRLQQVEETRREKERREGSLRDALERNQRELDACGPDEGPGEPERWERGIRQYDELRERLSRVNREIGRLETERNNIPVSTESTNGLPTDFDLGTAQRRLDEIAATERAHQDRRHEREGVELQLVLKINQRAALGRTVDANARQVAHRERLHRLRRAFHPAGAPAELVGRRVARLQAKVNEYLGALGARFRARATEGFNFEYQFEDSPDHPRVALELSGGERTAMSVAFRLAALTSFGASVGLLCLDEASQALDADKITRFAELLENLKPLASTLGLQLLFITHQAELETSFDQVIQL